ncbi:MAG: S9 family peptidase [Acidobacteriia bacterium]|nr:S9 family peptidase [Terriglobia bacterium]
MLWRLSSLFLAALGAVHAADLTLDQLFTRPYIWGTSPEQLKWSKRSHTLVFLWNASGRRFLDLYAYHADRGELVRLTDLESQKDDLTLTPDEKDSRQKQYPMPLPGIAPPFDVSQDGSRVAFAYRGDVWIASTKSQTPLRLTRTKEVESSPHFSPDGSHLAYIRGGQIYVHSFTDGSLSQITEGGAAREIAWSPDGSRIAYLVAADGRKVLLPNYSGQLVIAPPVSRSLVGDEPVESSLWIVPGNGGKPVRGEDSSFGSKVTWTQPLAWSPDSTRVLRVAVHPQMKKLEILATDVQGKNKVLYEETDPRWVFSSTALWSPDGAEILFSSERDGFAHLYKVSAAGGSPTQLTRGKWETFPGRFSSDPAWAGGYIYFGSAEVSTSQRHFYRMRPDGSGKEQLTQGEGIHRGFVASDGTIAYLRGDQHNPADLFVNGRQITHSTQKGFSDYRWPEIRYVQYPSKHDGKPVAAKIFLPPGYRIDDRNAPKRPAVFFIHGAGYASSVYQQWGAYLPIAHVFNSYLANRGYVVIDPDYRGSSGYGRDWRSDVYLDMGGPDLGDVLGGIDYLRGLGNIDVGKLGIWGISYGGFMTNTAMFKAPDAFLAGAAWAAVNDWENYNASYTSQRLTTPKENPEAYRRSSPIYFSQNLKNHLLMLHGMVDDNVLFQDAVQLSEKLLHEGKHFDTFFYPEESHVFYRDESLRDAFRRTSEWFDRYLK